ncbi:MAG: XRE family transcriptional regulator [Mesorhizobium sp.]|uniref:helix-turn-helix domain-containing protein n=1 Tax=Mesorhizobium sp. INR15 TaxID=2654248 RepID=UPI0027E4854A|nr:XRE family transcriptional regulator [Mesorhizobium sp. INR15]
MAQPFPFRIRYAFLIGLSHRTPECLGFQQAATSATKAVAGDFTMITGAQCRAARALVEWTREKLAGNSGVDALTIEEFERRISLPGQDVRDTLQTALENAGAVFIAENGGGIGVRLKLNRSEVKRIGVLENEGGIVGMDAVP